MVAYSKEKEGPHLKVLVRLPREEMITVAPHLKFNGDHRRTEYHGLDGSIYFGPMKSRRVLFLHRQMTSSFKSAN